MADKVTEQLDPEIIKDNRIKNIHDHVESKKGKKTSYEELKQVGDDDIAAGIWHFEASESNQEKKVGKVGDNLSQASEHYRKHSLIEANQVGKWIPLYQTSEVDEDGKEHFYEIVEPENSEDIFYRERTLDQKSKPKFTVTRLMRLEKSQDQQLDENTFNKVKGLLGEEEFENYGFSVAPSTSEE